MANNHGFFYAWLKAIELTNSSERLPAAGKTF